MAESIAAEVLKPVIEPVVKSVIATIKRQFNYLCCFTSNIATLKDEAERLDDATKELQGQVDRARDDVQVIVPAVETWLTDSEKIRDEMNGILNQVPNVESGCLKLSARFSLSKRAKKTADSMEELRGRCKFEAIAQPGPPPAMEGVLLGMTYEFQSRKQIEEGIMKSLRDGEMNMIGICGMGGLGKTTMAKMIMNRALKDHLFDEVVMAVVSQPVDKLKIQLEIGGALGLKDLEKETSEASRVQKLHARLTAGSKRILLVLDDVWGKLMVEEFGIPRGCKACTILLTSRNHDVLRAMNVEMVFGMEVLTEEDAWFLFRKTTGICVDDARLNSIAKEVVKECRGLPIAIITLGAALKDENDKRIWKVAVTQMRKASTNNIPDFIKEVYNPLKISYDRLQSEEAKFVFLLCCLFGEDVDIPVEHLTYFCMGLDIFEGGINNLDEGRNTMYNLIKILKSRSLLLDGPNEEHVRMHDVVRDVCTFISKEKGYIGGNDCTWISSSQTTVGERTKLPTKLRLLFLSCNYSEQEEEINFDNSFVEGTRELKVLYIENYSSFTSLPHTTESLRNLGTLVLDSCPKLETLSFVGQLLHLEILICRHCELITELPQEIKGLNRLKLLELTTCSRLERIGCDIISSLVGLEELKIVRSFKKWEAWDVNQERENGNARLRELEALTNLRCLEIEIDDLALAAENMRLSSKLERFEIGIPHVHSDSYYWQPKFFSYSSNKKMSLKWQGENCLGDWVEQLLGDAECLYLNGNGANNVDYLAKFPNIRRLELESVSTMKNIGRISMDDATVFPHMEFLRLDDLPQLKEILDGPISSNSFENLNELRLEYLPELKQMWKSSSTSPILPKLKKIKLRGLPNLATFELPLQAISFIEIRDCRRLQNLEQLLSAREDHVSQLEFLRIWGCEMMEQVFLWNDNEEEERRITKIMFPKLKEVRLHNLPKLVTLCEGIGGIEFSLLNTMHITTCPKMKSMVSSEENNCGGSRNADKNDNHCPRLFCQEKVSFDSLKSLEIQGMNALYCQNIPLSIFNRLEALRIYGNYKGSMSLITLSIARNFVSLRHLLIWHCDEIVEVIKDEEAVIGGERTLLFPKLEMLVLWDLCKLVSFCKGNCYVNCRRVSIINCSNVKIFNLGFHVSFPFNGLEELTISRYEGNMSLFSSSMARSLVNLKELTIRDCKEMVKVIEDEKEEENVVSSGAAQTTTTILFPNLKELKLDRLSKLESFCKGNCYVNCRSVKIEGFSNMKIFNLGSNVSFPFNGLEDLTIRRYEGRMSLFSSSMARSLVNLKELSIEDCKEMVKVIEDEKEEENVVSSGAAQTTATILFPNLQELKLDRLYKLESFCEWKCDIKMPSLKEVQINRCDDMKVFSLGTLSTPNLETVRININEVLESGEKDLNGTLKQQYLIRMEKQKKAATCEEEEEKQRKTITEEDEGITKAEIEEEQNLKTITPAEEDEEGRKGEIEEEQNS